MHTHLVNSILECVYYELDFGTMDLLNDLLDDMVTMLILNTMIHLISDLIY